MSEQEQKKQKKKKKKKQVIIEQKPVETEVSELIEVLEELEKQKKYVDVQVCPNCKSTKVRRVKSTEGDVLGHMGLSSPKHECTKCGWRGKLVIKASNKPTTIKDVAIMAETNEAEQEK
ncbi:MAG: hypothetical protein ACOWW1_09445 [archaeon]|nr:hypothetical protein [Candidatus Bathyarchaeum sp.]